jgi:hypothetical protein
MLSENMRCPQCHATAEVVPSRHLRFVCSVCGEARIVIDDPSVVRSPEQLELLKTATVAGSARSIWRLMAFVVGGFGVFSVLVLWLAIAVARPPPAASLAAAVAVLVPFAFSIFSLLRSRGYAAQIEPALERAWIVAARDIARARGGELDAAELARLTRVSEKEADRLLAQMSAERMPAPVQVDKRLSASP